MDSELVTQWPYAQLYVSLPLGLSARARMRVKGADLERHNLSPRS